MSKLRRYRRYICGVALCCLALLISVPARALTFGFDAHVKNTGMLTADGALRNSLGAIPVVANAGSNSVGYLAAMSGPELSPWIRSGAAILGYLSLDHALGLAAPMSPLSVGEDLVSYQVNRGWGDRGAASLGKAPLDAAAPRMESYLLFMLGIGMMGTGGALKKQKQRMRRAVWVGSGRE